MKVPNSEQGVLFKENEDLYKRMNKSLERKIASKEREIKDIDSLYDKKVQQAHTNGEVEYLQSLERNQQRIIGESNTFEEKIQTYKDQLKKTQDTVAREEAALKGTEREKLEKLKTQLNENFEEQYANTKELQDEIQANTNDSVKKIAIDSKTQKLTMENNAQYEINALSSEFNNKAANSEKEFRSKLDSDIRLHTAEVNRQKDELKKIMLIDAEKNKRLSAEKNRVHKDQLTFQEKHQQDMLIQRDQDFKVRYEQMAKEHNSILENLSNRLNEDVKNLMTKTSTKKEQIANRSEDPFYRIEQLNPKLTEDPKEVTVALPVAEYEKENVQLSTQGRTIKITLSRKFSDNLNAEDGSLNRSTRSELFSKEMKSIDLLDARKITQSYADGVLTFKIQKA